MKRQMIVHLPDQFEMLCELLNTTPEIVLHTFMNDLSQGLTSSGGDERMMAAAYFMRCCYGIELFEQEEIESIFEGLGEIRKLFYQYGNQRIEEYREEAGNRYREWFAYWQEEKKKRGL